MTNHKDKARNLGWIDSIADWLIGWIGSTASLVIHSLFFIFIFGLRFVGLATESILLILTTVVSLEAIYLSILIQRTVNKSSQALLEVTEDLEEVTEDIGEIQEDIDEIQEDIDADQRKPRTLARGYASSSAEGGGRALQVNAETSRPIRSEFHEIQEDDEPTASKQPRLKQVRALHQAITKHEKVLANLERQLEQELQKKKG